MERAALEAEFEERVAALGFELVELVFAGSKARPVLRLRIDRPDSEPGRGVSLEDCAAVSRVLESWLDRLPDMGARYVLEVSSPGVERPLLRPGDWQRFQGREVALHGAKRWQEGRGGSKARCLGWMAKAIRPRSVSS